MHGIETSKKAHSRHRLYVVVPIFLVCAWVGIGTMGQSGSGTVVNDHRVAVDGGVVTMSGDFLRVEGVAQVASKGWMQIQAHEYALKAWDGVFALSTTPSTVTVASLTTPVLISQQHHRWLVPVGMQMTVQVQQKRGPEPFTRWLQDVMPIPLPAYYLREELSKADALYDSTTLKPLSTSRAWASSFAGSALMFPASRLRAEAAYAEVRMQQVSQALYQDDLVQFDASMHDAQTHAMLHAENDASLFTLLSFALPVKRDVHILAVLLRNPDFAALLRLHPLTRDRVWQQSEGEANHQLLLLTQLLQPLADRRTEASTAMSIESWKAGWDTLVQDNVLTSEVLTAILPFLQKQITALDNEGYPARARGYAVALVEAMRPLSVTSEIVATSIADLQSLYDIPLHITATEEPIVEPIVHSSASTPVSALQHIPFVPESDVRSLIVEAGFMVTTQSVLHRRDDGIYEISKVVLGTPSGDRIIDFAINPVDRVVVDIEKNGQVLPYTLPFEKYVEWVRGQ